MTCTSTDATIDDFLYKSQLFGVPTELCFFMQCSGSDKGMGHHNYTTLYHALFQHNRDTTYNVFELGLGTLNTSIASNMAGFAAAVPCGSLRGWKRYFPNATVYGADIDENILVEEERIVTYPCDQTDPQSIAALWNHFPEDHLFDIIIEDGLHTFAANKTFLENSSHKLRHGGLYIVEDILREEIPLFQKYIAEHKHEYAYMRLVEIPNPQNMSDNNVLVIVK